MYRVLDPNKAGANDHLQLYNEKLKNAVDLHLTPPVPPEVKKPGRPKTPPFQVKNGTYARTFCERVRDDEVFRKRLLTDDFNEQLLLIDSVEAEVKAALVASNNAAVVDNMDENAYFIHVCKEIFVNGFFDNSENFNKSTHIIHKDLGVCPYCGRAYIFHNVLQDNPDKCEYKPQIEHFLPKDLYPYLGVNYYNLIPSCTPCNTLDAKGSNDPLGEKRLHRYLMNPYEFDDSRINFSFIPTMDTISDEPIPVVMKCDGEYSKGYKEWLHLENHYKQHGLELRHVYNRMVSQDEMRREDLKDSYNISEAFLNKLPKLVYGFDIDNEDPSKVLLYKFYKDTYSRLRKYVFGV